jgi:hypothetical protein
MSMRFTRNSPLYLPQELLRLIFSYVDDLDIRRHFRFFERLTDDRYDALRRVVRYDYYYRWQCRASCLPSCTGHRHPLSYNPVLTPVYTGSGSPPTPSSLPSNPKAVGAWKKFSICFPLLNCVQRERSSDLLHVTIVQFDHCVTYDVGIWIIKRKTGEGAKERDHMYYLDGLPPDTYFTDYLEWSFDVV